MSSLDDARKRVRLLRAYDASEVSERTGIDTGTESLTQQQFAEEADVNTIVRRFGLMPIPGAMGVEGVYGDFSGITDYDSAVDAIRKAEEGFMSLPAELRAKFQNDPGLLLEFMRTAKEDDIDSLNKAPVVEPPAEDRIAEAILRKVEERARKSSASPVVPPAEQPPKAE